MTEITIGTPVTGIAFDIDTGKLTLPRGEWDITVSGGGSATENRLSVTSAAETFAIADLHQADVPL